MSTSTEYGLFSDEGLVEQGMWSREEAEQVKADHYDEDDDLTVREVCAEHREHVADHCPEGDE